MITKQYYKTGTKTWPIFLINIFLTSSTLWALYTSVIPTFKYDNTTRKHIWIMTHI